MKIQENHSSNQKLAVVQQIRFFLLIPFLIKSIKRNQNNLPVGDYLYAKRTELQAVKKSLLDRSIHERDQQQKAIFNQSSQKLFFDLQSRKLKAIFNLLDGDQDGKISAGKIDIGTMETKILRVFAPLLVELEELEQELDWGEFEEAAERLLKTLSPSERAEVLGLNERKGNKGQEWSFQVFYEEIGEGGGGG